MNPSEIASIRIPINKVSGEIIISERYFPEILTIARNGCAKTEIINKSIKYYF